MTTPPQDDPQPRDIALEQEASEQAAALEAASDPDEDGARLPRPER
jgi:hypothetical protein